MHRAAALLITTLFLSCSSTSLPILSSYHSHHTEYDQFCIASREEFLSKKRQTSSPVDSTMEQATASLFPCDHCDYTNVSEKGLRQHMRMKHGKSQLDTQLQSSSPPTPEIFRKPTSYSDALAVSPIGDSTRVIPCNNCDKDMSPNHICSTHSCGGCDEVFSSDKELTDHERAVHPNMCHVCFKVFVDENSFLTHFRQEHPNL